MNERWIKLRLHPEHPRIVALAHHLGLPREYALAMAVRWFHYLDTLSGQPDPLPEGFINEIVRSETNDFASSALAIGWLKESANPEKPGLLVVNWKRWFRRDKWGRLASPAPKKSARKNRAPEKSRASQEKTREKTGAGPRQAPISNSLEGAGSADPEKIRQGQKCQLVLLNVGMSKRNMNATLRRVMMLEHPYRFLTDVVKRAEDAGVTSLAGYIFNAIKEESANVNTERNS